MNNFLVLYIDLEFVAAIIHKSDGTYVSVLNNDEDLFWLYFHFEPAKDKITFSKDYRQHFQNFEPDYYGDFLNQITDETSNYVRNQTPKPFIDLLSDSGFINLFTTKFNEIRPDTATEIPTLISFSSTIKEGSRQILSDYLARNNFSIKSDAISICELTSCYYWRNNKIKPQNGHVVLYLEATNSTLHLIKHVFWDKNFLIDKSSVKSYPNKGCDPRKSAILQIVVKEVNQSIGLIISEEEIVRECKHLEYEADKWLEAIENAPDSGTINIREVTLTRAPGMKRDILIRKRRIEDATGYAINELITIYKTFEKKIVEDQPIIDAVVLLGESFNNERCEEEFKKHVKDKLIISPLSELAEILALYPEIDLEFYSDRESIRAKLVEIEKIIKARIYLEEAKKLFQEGKLYKALQKIQEAMELDPSSNDIKDYHDFLTNERETWEFYCDLFNKARLAEQAGDFDKALIYSRQALNIIKNDEISRIINYDEINSFIESLASKIKNIQQFTIKADELFNTGRWREAEQIYREILKIKRGDEHSLSQLGKIKNELEYKKNVELGDKWYNAERYDEAKKYYEIVLKNKPGDPYCESQIKKINEGPVDPEFKNLVDLADRCFSDQKWDKAKKYYEEALKHKHGDNHCQDRLKLIKTELEYRRCIETADRLFSEQKWDEAKKSYKEAQKCKPEDNHCRDRLESIRLEQTYLEYTGLAEKYLEENKLDSAEEYLNKAQKIKPLDKYCNQLLSEIKGKRLQIKNHEDFKIFAEQADRCFSMKKLTKAKKLYQEALLINQDDPYCVAQLAKIKSALEITYKRLTINAFILICFLALIYFVAFNYLKGGNRLKYKETIDLADKAFVAEKWDDAENYYTAAMKFRSGSKYCSEQLSITKIEKDYRNNIEQGDKAFSERKRDEAIKYYNAALKIKPGDNYSIEQLKKAEEELERDFRIYIEPANKAFLDRKWDKAQELYNKALEIKPGDNYCFEQLDKIKNGKEVDFKKIVKLADELFSVKKFDSANIYYNKALEITPGDEHCSNKLEEIRRSKQPAQVTKLTFDGLNNLNFYIGSIKDGKMHGTGNYTFVTKEKVYYHGLSEIDPDPGDFIIGEWAEGILIEGELFVKDGSSKAKIKRKKF